MPLAWSISMRSQQFWSKIQGAHRYFHTWEFRGQGFQRGAGTFIEYGSQQFWSKIQGAHRYFHTWEFRGQGFQRGAGTFIEYGSQQFWSKIHRPQRGIYGPKRSYIFPWDPSNFDLKFIEVKGQWSRGSAPAPRRSAGAGPQVVPPKTQIPGSRGKYPGQP